MLSVAVPEITISGFGGHIVIFGLVTVSVYCLYFFPARRGSIPTDYMLKFQRC